MDAPRHQWLRSARIDVREGCELPHQDRLQQKKHGDLPLHLEHTPQSRRIVVSELRTGQTLRLGPASAKRLED